MSQNMIHSTEGFLNAFFSKREMDAPDGRPIYEYKIGDGRYFLLKQLLRDYWKENTFTYACFVIFAIEFLRKEYEEGTLKWKDIFQEIDKEQLNTHIYRKEITLAGLAFWKRSVFQGNASQEIIETLRLESGLPNFVLGERSNICRLISKTFQFMESFQISDEDIISQISDEGSRLRIPQVLQQEIFYNLVLDFNTTLLQLKRKFDLDKQTKPVEFLDANFAMWRKQFPVKIDDQGAAREFIDGLLTDISKIEKLEKPAINILHKLSKVEENYQIQSSLSILKGIHSIGSFSLEKDSFDKLPGFFMFNIEVQGQTKLLNSLSKTVDGRISCTNMDNVYLPSGIYKHEWCIQLSSQDNSVEEKLMFPATYSLPSNEPLVFINKEGEWIFYDSGITKTKEQKVLLLIPVDNFEINIALTPIGKIDEEYTIYEIGQDCSVIDKLNELEYEIKLSQDSSEVYLYELTNNDRRSGYRFNQGINREIFIDVPKIFRIHKNSGIRQRFRGTIEYKSLKKGGWNYIEGLNEYGLINLRGLNRKGEVVFYRKLGILPKDFKIEISQNPPFIKIFNTCELQVFVSTNNRLATIEQDHNKNYVIDFKDTDVYSEEKINVLISSANVPSLLLALPNPTYSKVFVDKEGKIVSRKIVDINGLSGMAIKINNLSGLLVKQRICLVLIDHFILTKITSTRNLEVGAQESKNFSVFRFKSELERLFSFTESVQAKIKICFENEPHNYIDVAQYSAELKNLSGILKVEGDLDTDNFRLCAFLLNQPFRKNCVISLRFSVTVEGWSLAENLTQDGIWFIYSSSDSPLTIKPKVEAFGVVVEPDIRKPIETISETCTMSYGNRKAKLIELFDSIAFDFNNDSWRELYNVYEETVHLPLNSLDVWKGLVLSEKGLVSYVLSVFSDGQILSRLTAAFNINWNLVKVNSWIEVFESWKQYIENTYPTNAETIIEEKLRQISDGLNLPTLCEILKGSVHSTHLDQVKMFIHAHINGDQNFNITGIRGRNKGVNWPTGAKYFLSEKINQISPEIKDLIPFGFPGYQKPVIYLPFILAYHSVVGNLISPEELGVEIKFGLNSNMEFDPAYFDFAYSTIQSYCFSKYYNKIIKP